MKTYTLQSDSHGNLIVCGDATPRSGYIIIFTTTSYSEAIKAKAYANKR